MEKLLKRLLIAIIFMLGNQVSAMDQAYLTKVSADLAHKVPVCLKQMPWQKIAALGVAAGAVSYGIKAYFNWTKQVAMLEGKRWLDKNIGEESDTDVPGFHRKVNGELPQVNCLTANLTAKDLYKEQFNKVLKELKAKKGLK